jgi:hypothetical protein
LTGGRSIEGKDGVELGFSHIFRIKPTPRPHGVVLIETTVGRARNLGQASQLQQLCDLGRLG